MMGTSRPIHLTKLGENFSWKREMIKFCTILLSAVAFIYLVLPLIEGIGLPPETARERFSAFMRLTAFQPENKIFLYINGWVIVFGTFLVYHFFIFPRLEKKRSLLFGEGVLALVFLLAVWGNPFSVAMRLLIFGLRMIGTILILWMATRKFSSPKVTDSIISLAENLLFGFSLGLGIWFIKAKVMGYVSFVSLARTLVNYSLPIMFFLGLAMMEHRLKSWPKYLADGIALTVIFLLVFRNDVHYFDFSHFIYTTNDIMLGKDMLFNVVSQYGFLNIHFLGMIFKLFHVVDGYRALSIINSIFYFLGYASIYFLLRNVSRHVIFSGLATISILIVHFFLGTHIPIHWTPSVGFLRFGAFLPVFYLLYNYRLREIRYGQWAIALSVVFAFFWVMDAGIYILSSFVGLAVFKYIFAKEDPQRGDLLRIFYKTFLIWLGVLFYFSLCVLVKYGAAPRWENLLYFHKFFIFHGMAVRSLNDFYLWPLVAFVYFVAVYAFFSFYRYWRHADAWIFLSFYGLQSLLYYVAEVILDHLARAALPALMLFFGFLGYLLRGHCVCDGRYKVVQLKPFVLSGSVVIAFSLIGSVKSFESHRTLTEHLRYNLPEFVKNMRSDSLTKFMPRNRIKEFQYDVHVIQELIPPDDPLPIVSKHDSLYYWYACRKSFFKIGFYPNFNIQASDIPQAIKEITASQTRFIFIDHSFYQCFTNQVSDHWLQMREKLGLDFQKSKELGLLDLYERITPQAPMIDKR